MLFDCLKWIVWQFCIPVIELMSCCVRRCLLFPFDTKQIQNLELVSFISLLSFFLSFLLSFCFFVWCMLIHQLEDIANQNANANKFDSCVCTSVCSVNRLPIKHFTLHDHCKLIYFIFCSVSYVAWWSWANVVRCC